MFVRLRNMTLNCRFPIWLAVGFLVVVAIAPRVGAAQLSKPKLPAKQFQKMAEILGPSVRSKAPSWADIDRKPLFTFAWLSDFHLDQSRKSLIEKALRYVDSELKPNFAIITGDNCALALPPINPNQPKSLSLRRQEFMKMFLDKHLKTPYAIIPGDNWPQDFEKVFGASQYSFDYGGMHFMFTSLDRSCHEAGAEGVAVFDDRTWKWMQNDLDKNGKKPTIVVMHESAFPPTFVEAKQFRQLLDERRNVIAGFHGHFHVDMELSDGKRKYLICPALGPVEKPAMKLIAVYRDILIVRTIEYDRTDGQFKMVNKWQRIDVPVSIRDSLVRPKTATFVKQNFSSVPPHPHRTDSKLKGRSDELLRQIQSFIFWDMPQVLRRRTIGR